MIFIFFCFRSQVVQEQANNRLYQLKRYAKKHSDDQQSSPVRSNNTTTTANNTTTSTTTPIQTPPLNSESLGSRDRSKSLSRALGKKVMHDLAQDSTSSIDAKNIDAETKTVLDKLQQERKENK